MDINNSILVTGTIKLLNDVITALTVISFLIAIITVIIYFAKKSYCDQQEGKMYTRRAVIAIGCYVLILLIKIIIQTITSYYT